ncbi:erythromycin esterase family protein [uncultured Kriegella sp.]|uniref:erythromycin esterase family protein n=1 Tax=uncultured Kriegella sp. TaxID=1798910 RepID=UPI0030DB7049
MTFFKTACIGIAVLVLHTTTYAQEKYNLNFDDFDSENEFMPEGWFKWGNYENLNGENLTGEKLDENNYVGKVVSDQKGKFGCITYKIPAHYVGDTIRLSGRIKYENVKGFVGLLMRVDGSGSNKSLAFESMQKLKIKGTNDWKEYTIMSPYPVGAESIYVGGILAGKGIAWFDDFKITIDGKDIQELKKTPKNYLKDYNADKLDTAIRDNSKPINLSLADSLFTSLDPLIERLGNKKIVAIGESTHGTSEFYQMREIITKRLIEEKDFNLFVLESPYDDIELLNKDLLEKPLDGLIKKHLLSIYQTKEMKSFLQWYKENYLRNDIKFKGCDDSYWVFYEVLIDNVEDINDKKLNRLLKELKSNIDKIAIGNLKKEYKKNTAIYNNILDVESHLKATNNLNEKIEEIIFNGKNTYINYANMKNKKQFQSRDEIMAERISFFAKNKSNKIIVWAHNAHISNQIIADNEIGVMGRDLKKEFGEAYHSIGFSTLEGSYSFIDEKFINGDHLYTDELKKATLETTENHLWENVLALNGSAFYLNMTALRKESNLDAVIGPTKLIGYSKETNMDIYQTPFMNIFDSLVFIKKTSATTPLDE